MLDARNASVLNKIIENCHFKKKVSLEEQKAQKEDRFLRGRQIAFMIYDYFRVIGAHDTVLDYADLFSITLRDDDVQEFVSRWDEVLLSVSKIPSDDGLITQKQYWNCTRWRFVKRYRCPNYQKLKTMVKRNIDQKLRLRNFDARNEKIETHEDCVALKEEKVRGQCSKGDQCSFRHESDDHAQKPKPKAATPSEPSMTRGRSVVEEKYPRQK